MTSNDEVYLSYLCDQILVASNIIHKKLDKYDEFLSSYTTPVISYHEQPSWHVATDVVQPPNGQPWNYVQPGPDQQVPTYGLMSAFAPEPYRQQFNPHIPEPPYGQSAYQNLGYPPVPANRPYGQHPHPPTGWHPQPPQPHPLQQHVTSWQTTAEPYFHNQPMSWQTPPLPPPQHYFHNQPKTSNDYNQSLQQSYWKLPLVTAALPHQNYPQLPPMKIYQPPPSPTTYQQLPLTSAATATNLLHQTTSRSLQRPTSRRPPTGIHRVAIAHRRRRCLLLLPRLAPTFSEFPPISISRV